MNDTAPDPAEPTLSLSRDLTIGGQPSLGFDTYTVRQLADLIEPALQQQCQGGTADAARRAAHAIVCRHNRCAGEQSAPPPRNALDAPQTAAPSAPGHGGHPGGENGPHTGTQSREPHRCGNCEGIDPDTCLMNPDRPCTGECDPTTGAYTHSPHCPGTPDAEERRQRYARAMDAVTGGICPADLIDAVVAVADAEQADLRATVLREAIDVAREEGHRLEEVAGIEPARGARSVAYLLRQRLVKAQRAAPQAGDDTTGGAP